MSAIATNSERHNAPTPSDLETLRGVSQTFYKTVGEIVTLMGFSPLHAHFSVRDISDLIMPPVLLGQYRLHSDTVGRAKAFVAWGCFSDDAVKKFLGCEEVLTPEDWQSGRSIFITDVIAPFGNAQSVIDDLRSIIFKDDVVYALRYAAPGKPRQRVSTFYGANISPPNRSNRSAEWNALLRHPNS